MKEQVLVRIAQVDIQQYGVYLTLTVEQAIEKDHVNGEYPNTLKYRLAPFHYKWLSNKHGTDSLLGKVLTANIQDYKKVLSIE